MFLSYSLTACNDRRFKKIHTILNNFYWLKELKVNSRIIVNYKKLYFFLFIGIIVKVYMYQNLQSLTFDFQDFDNTTGTYH